MARTVNIKILKDNAFRQFLSMKSTSFIKGMVTHPETFTTKQVAIMKVTLKNRKNPLSLAFRFGRR